MRSDKAALSLSAYETLEPRSGWGLGGDEDGLQLKPLGTGAGRTDHASSFAAIPPDSSPGKPSVSIARGRAVAVQARLTWQGWPHVGQAEATVRKEARDVVYALCPSDKSITRAQGALSQVVCLCFLCRTTPSIPAPALPAGQRQSSTSAPQELAAVCCFVFTCIDFHLPFCH